MTNITDDILSKRILEINYIFHNKLDCQVSIGLISRLERYYKSKMFDNIFNQIMIPVGLNISLTIEKNK